MISQRYYYLDWLRVLGILIVFIYHSSRFFNVEDWVVKTETWYPSVEVWNRFSTTWMMPLMFVISGASLFYAIGKGDFVKFARDKILRLLVPLLVGALTHAGLQAYLYNRTHGLFSGSYLQFLPQYYHLDTIEWMGMHLWYLLYLFVFSIILYPLLRWLKGEGRNVLSRLNDALLPLGVAVSAVFPVLLPYILLDGDSPLMDDQGGWSVLSYLWFVLLGFFVASDERLQAGIQARRQALLLGGLALVIGYVALLGQIEDPETISGPLIVAGVMRAYGGWMCVLAFFGYGRQYLTTNTPQLKYASEAVLPFYILHQTVLLAVGYYVVQWPIHDALKWAVIVLISFPLIMVIYEYLVRRWNVMRFLFGMKPRPPRAAEGNIQPQPGGAAPAG